MDWEERFGRGRLPGEVDLRKGRFWEERLGRTRALEWREIPRKREYGVRDPKREVWGGLLRREGFWEEETERKEILVKVKSRFWGKGL